MVYSPDQVKLKYVVRFSVDGEQLKEFRPAVDTSITELEQQTQGEHKSSSTSCKDSVVKTH